MTIQIKLTRGDVSSIIAGPFEDDVDAQYHAKRLRKEDPNPDSVYEVVDCSWVVKNHGIVVGFYETEKDAKREMAYMVRGDPDADLVVDTY